MTKLNILKWPNICWWLMLSPPTSLTPENVISVWNTIVETHNLENMWKNCFEQTYSFFLRLSQVTKVGYMYVYNTENNSTQRNPMKKMSNIYQSLSSILMGLFTRSSYILVCDYWRIVSISHKELREDTKRKPVQTKQA